ncbi:2-oxo acid dehydrogenase subunit E2 [uncultured Pseudoteredinibacter sp.]|uniref:2-oxo acid dehydrogenase subunit E2 n=1 Tax=uncultured Pseudoteredinibacter sp. TaxID=1641701 RepID=UPI002610653F|nr:2-oxo acid dehydrogenase subunit E2 [uncultured Pseudoteredinibacter sp.]
MSNIIQIPTLGDGDVSGVVGSIFVSVGDLVDEDTIAFEVETDKVVVEVPCGSSGVIKALLLNSGDNVQAGQDMLEITTSDNSEDGAEPSSEKVETEEVFQEENTAVEESEGAGAQHVSLECVLPSLGDGDVKGIVGGIHVSPGSHVCEGDVILEVETDKVVVEVPSEHTGRVIELLLSSGDEARSGTPYVCIEVENTSSSASKVKETMPKSPDVERVTKAEVKPSASSSSFLKTEVSSLVGVKAGPSTRRFARELGVDLGSVSGTGSRGRITVADVKSYVRNSSTAEVQSEAKSIAKSIALPDVSQFGPTHRVGLSKIAQATSANMDRSWSQVPHAWADQKLDITELERHRKRLKADALQRGCPLTITAFLCKAMAQTIREFPLFNACYDEEAGELIYRDYINIGIAVDTPRGLVVPVIKSADQKNVLEIAADISLLSEKAVNGKLALSDMQGSGITLSNLGGLGVSGIKPMVNWPEVAILGVAAGSMEPQWSGDAFVPRLRMPVSMGIDHRVINGADAARFLATFKRLVEDPVRLGVGF